MKEQEVVHDSSPGNLDVEDFEPNLLLQTFQNGNETSEMFFIIGITQVKFCGMKMQIICYHKLAILIIKSILNFFSPRKLNKLLQLLYCLSTFQHIPRYFKSIFYVSRLISSENSRCCVQ